MPQPLPDQATRDFRNGTLKPEQMQRIEMDLQRGFIVDDQESGKLMVDVEAIKAHTKESARRQREDVIGETVGTGAELLGGAAGIAATGVVPVPGARVAGAGAGAAAGRAIVEGLQAGGIVPGGEGKTPFQRAEEVASAGGAGVIGEATGSPIFKFFQKGAAPFRSAVTKSGLRAQRFIEKGGGIVSPAKVTKAKSLDVLESVAKNSLFGGAGFNVIEDKAVDIFSKQADDIVRKLTESSTREEIGAIGQTIFERRKEAFDSAMKGKFAAIDDLTKGAVVDLAPIRKDAAALLSESKAGIGFGEMQRVLKDFLSKGAVPKGISPVEAAKSPQRFLSFKDAQTLRSSLLTIARKEGDEQSARTVGAARKLAKGVDSAMLKAVDSAKFIDPVTGHTAKELFRAANREFREGRLVFGHRIAKQFMNQLPDASLDVLLRKNRPTALREARTLVNNPRVWRKLQGAFYEKILRDLTRGDKVLKGAPLLSKIDDFGKETLKELFPGGRGLVGFRRMAEALKTIQDPNPNNLGGIFIQLKQAGAVTKAVQGVGSGMVISSGFAGPALILGGPAAVGAAMTSKSFQQWLTRGIKLGAKARNTSGFLGRGAAILAKEGIQAHVQPAPDITREDLQLPNAAR
jgi:hypothetical protein